MTEERGNFYDLKRALMFPDMAGPMKLKTDTAILYDMLKWERAKTKVTMILAIAILAKEGHTEESYRCAADAKMLDMCYRHDMDLLRDYMLRWGIAFI